MHPPDGVTVHAFDGTMLNIGGPPSGAATSSDPAIISVQSPRRMDTARLPQRCFQQPTLIAFLDERNIVDTAKLSFRAANVVNRQMDTARGLQPKDLKHRRNNPSVNAVPRQKRNHGTTGPHTTVGNDIAPPVGPSHRQPHMVADDVERLGQRCARVTEVGRACPNGNGLAANRTAMREALNRQTIERRLRHQETPEKQMQSDAGRNASPGIRYLRMLWKRCAT